MNNSIDNDSKKTVTVDEASIVKYTIDGSEIKLTPSWVQQYIVEGGGKISLREYKNFAELCKFRKLNPYLKEAHCIKFGNNDAEIVVSKDVVFRRAILHPKYDGMDGGIIVRNAETKEIAYRNGTFYIKSEEIVVGGWAKAYRKDWSRPTYITVSFDEVARHKSGGALNYSWDKQGATMVEKVAKVRALRESFAEELGGMYIEDEGGINSMDINFDFLSEQTTSDEPPFDESSIIDISPEAPQEITFDEI